MNADEELLLEPQMNANEELIHGKDILGSLRIRQTRA
jgi:hypothetical protein